MAPRLHAICTWRVEGGGWEHGGGGAWAALGGGRGGDGSRCRVRGTVNNNTHGHAARTQHVITYATHPKLQCTHKAVHQIGTTGGHVSQLWFIKVG